MSLKKPRRVKVRRIPEVIAAQQKRVGTSLYSNRRSEQLRTIGVVAEDGDVPVPVVSRVSLDHAHPTELDIAF